MRRYFLQRADGLQTPTDVGGVLNNEVLRNATQFGRCLKLTFVCYDVSRLLSDLQAMNGPLRRQCSPKDHLGLVNTAKSHAQVICMLDHQSSHVSMNAAGLQVTEGPTAHDRWI